MDKFCPKCQEVRQFYTHTNSKKLSDPSLCKRCNVEAYKRQEIKELFSIIGNIVNEVDK